VASSPETASPGENNAEAASATGLLDLNGLGTGVLLDRVTQPFSGADPDATCKDLLDLQRELEGKGPASCAVYPPWIAHLATQLSPGDPSACNGDAPYRLAVGEIREGGLCPWGNAYLAAYYAHKRIADRSLAFLQEAIRLAPQDPWVRLAEVLYYQNALQDPETAQQILHELIGTPPVSALSRYLLACGYIRKGDYRQAGTIFDPVARSYPDRPAFQRIQAALDSAQSAPYRSAARAGAMLELALTFSTLKDHAMAEELYREVLREIPDRMSAEEKRTAHLELGRIQEMHGDKLKASASYRNALRVDPRSQEAQQRLRTLTDVPAFPR